MNNSDNSGINTILIVIVIIILVAFGVWWFNRSSLPEDNSDLNIDVDLPGGNGNDGGTESGGGGETSTPY